MFPLQSFPYIATILIDLLFLINMLTFALLPLALFGLAILCVGRPIFIYFRDVKGFRQYPAPSVAAITNLWLMISHYLGKRTQLVHDAHAKLGKVVRIAPNHLSFTSADAIKDIYGHGTATFKDKFYNTFVGSHRQLLDTLDKTVHARKRKLFAAAFAQKQVEEKEIAISEDIQELIHQLDKLATKAPTPGQTTFPEHELTDIRRWFNLLTLDLACDFSFGMKLGFVKQGDDLTTCERIDGSTYLARPEAAVNPNLLFTSTLGYAPPHLLRFNQKIFSWHEGVAAGQVFTDFIIRLVRRRFALEGDGEKRSDFFQSLNYTRDGVPIGLELGELIQECALLMNAGSETTTCALQNIVHYLCLNPRCMEKLYEELVSVLDDDEEVPAYDKVKFLPYLRAVIDETLRHRPSLSLGLARVTPDEGMSIAGIWVPGDTTVSMPTWSVHHDPELFERPDEFIPERWLGESGANLQKYFLPFSTGARACVGRNMAYMELTLITAALVRRYYIALSKPDWMPTVYETTVIKTGPMPVKIWRRESGKEF